MKRKFVPLEIEQSYVPELPSSARTQGGSTFNPTADKWIYRDGVKSVAIDFASVSELGNNLLQSLKGTLLWYAENLSASHLENLHSRIVHFVRFLAVNGVTPIERITSVELLNYKSSLTTNVDWYLGHLSGLLKKWHDLGFSGVSSDAITLLNELRIKGNAKGVAVLTMDPFKGPFTVVEHEGIQAALNEAYALGNIERSEYLLAWLFMALGQRPAQYAALKVCDVSSVEKKDGTTEYLVRMPRVKQKDAHPRVQLKVRPLVPQIGRPLLEYAQKVQLQYAELLKDPSQAPLFPQKAPGVLAVGYEYHKTSKELSDTLTKTLNSLEVHSERTGGLLKISPVRFRRTFGTRAAQEGHGELVIAELLDHSDTQNVGVYVAAIPEIAARIDRAVAMELAPLAQAFKGVLIKDESEATRSGDPSSRIIDLRIDRSRKPMGSCGQHSFCGFSAPVACYTCTSFEPWLDGPPEAVLEHLIAKREQLLGSTDERVAAINDRTILAVAQVIQLCRDTQAKGALPHG